MEDDVFGRHVRHVRIISETLAIDSAENTLATGLYHTAESTLTNLYGDEFFVQLDKPMSKATDEQLKKLAVDLEWMKTHAEAYEMAFRTEKEEEVVNRLAHIFRWREHSMLDTIELDARFVDGPGLFSRPVARHIVHSDRQRLWARASQVYRLVMMAWARSGVAISSLLIYTNTTGCSVPSYDVTVGLPGLVDAGLARSSAIVKDLAFSFSTRMDHGWERLEQVYGQKVAAVERRRQRLHWQEIREEIDWQDMHGIIATTEGADYTTDDSDWDSDTEFDVGILDEKGSEIQGRYGDTMPQSLYRDNFPGISRLLQHLPNLQKLDLHMYQTLEYEAYDGGSRLHYYEAVFKHIVDAKLQFRQLKTLILRGLFVDAEDLLTFMRHHSGIERLELHNAMLGPRPGYPGWNNVLTTLCRSAVHHGTSLSVVFCSGLYNTSRTFRGQWGHPHNLLRSHEELKGQWVERWWLRSRQGRPVLWTREVLRDEFEHENAFGEEGGVQGAKNTAQWTPPAGLPMEELRVLQEEEYGRTYG
ncbi:hypothetical protein LZL87_007610 [Fusarium oxysporum]|uniref:Uncharacterized protein n=1 Tax=Fusarium oxysporum f. sp. rapae TaxID=485398 RepID=A0A8J5NG93_FUSOX|nr:hypothetical protein Forpe1208_v014340 [Fusarium oxysporum f. sp. rapae]KAI7772249.1 hypothetical protein LZL87_007610 [Fusarium oxysporum]